MAAGILGAALRLVLLTALGFVVFKIEPVRRRVLAPLLFLTLNVVLPLYFIHSFSENWGEVVHIGPAWMAAFFFGCLAIMLLQTAYGSWLTRRVGAFRESDHPRELIALFATHNAGYIPLPILAALAPPALQIYMFFVVLAFNLVFWSFAVSYISKTADDGQDGDDEGDETRRGGSRVRGIARAGRWRRYLPRLNMPIVGVLSGLAIAVFDGYRFVPEPLAAGLAVNASLALDLVLVVLGGALASVPNTQLRYRPEFGAFVLYKLVVFPALFLLVLSVIPVPGVGGELEWGVRLAILLQAAVPPATNLMIVTKRYGDTEQLHFVGSAVLFTYLAAAVTLPGFMFLASLLF